jgi:hypothetical protein
MRWIIDGQWNYTLLKADQGLRRQWPMTGIDNGVMGRTITTTGQVAINGTADTTTANVIELAYVNGKIWQENASHLWWGETSPNAGWAPTAGTSTSPLPATPTPTPTPTPTASPNDTVVLAGTSATVTDASGNKWTITASGQVAVNGIADTTTKGVTELAYVNKAVWQENTANLWWEKTSPSGSWSPGTGTATSPLPAATPITAASTTVTQSQISLVATSGNHMLFVQGSGDIISLSGGSDTVTDTGSGNIYTLPAAGKGTVAFTSNILASSGDTLDLRTALAATSWTGTASTLSKYLTVADSAQGATLSVSALPGGTATGIATISGATTATLTTFLAHSVT